MSMHGGTITSTFIDIRSVPRMATAACCAPLGSASLSDAEAEATARLFKALADPHRVKIINLLATSPDPGTLPERVGAPDPAPAVKVTGGRGGCGCGQPAD